MYRQSRSMKNHVFQNSGHKRGEYRVLHVQAVDIIFLISQNLPTGKLAEQEKRMMEKGKKIKR